MMIIICICETSCMQFHLDQVGFQFAKCNCSVPTATSTKECGKRIRSANWLESSLLTLNWAEPEMLFQHTISWIAVVVPRTTGFDARRNQRHRLITIRPSNKRTKKLLSVSEIINFYSTRRYYSLLGNSKRFWHQHHLLFIRCAA